MAKKAKRGFNSPDAHLPKKAPKKTGRRGIGPTPIDESKDFNTPTRKDTAAGAETEERQERQSELPGMPQERNSLVVGDRFSANYLKPIFGKAPKTGDKFISLQWSLALTEEHKTDGLLPKRILQGWKFIANNDRTKLDFQVPPQTVRVFLTSDDEEKQLDLVAQLSKVSLAVIQKKGDGEAVKIIRLNFRLQVPFSRDVARWAEGSYGAAYWLTMFTAQEELFEDEESE